MDTKFKIGDKVRLTKAVTDWELRDYGSDGTRGEVYTVAAAEEGLFGQFDYTTYRLRGNNWHKEFMLELYTRKNEIGGELVC